MEEPIPARISAPALSSHFIPVPGEVTTETSESGIAVSEDQWSFTPDESNVEAGIDRASLETFVRPQTIAHGQTWGRSAEIRKAVELHAMNLAMTHYAASWPEVIDVSGTESFDLLCRHADRELRVEVKGTTSLGSSVLVTRNEVRHAQQYAGCVALFVVSNIVANPAGCTGGTINILEPWDIQEDELEPVAFECRLLARRKKLTQPASA